MNKSQTITCQEMRQWELCLPETDWLTQGEAAQETALSRPEVPPPQQAPASQEDKQQARLLRQVRQQEEKRLPRFRIWIFCCVRNTVLICIYCLYPSF